MKIVISQPLFFPWIGAFEKIQLTDIYVHLNDVQFSKGSFTNRVQIKTPEGWRWLTVPLKGLHLGQEIQEVLIDNGVNWQQRHIDLLYQNYRKAPFYEEMIELVKSVYIHKLDRISDLSIKSIETVCQYFRITPLFMLSSELGVKEQKSQRVLEIVKKLRGTIYICGSGNQLVSERYLNHQLFEIENVRVEYINYQKMPYQQIHGEFTSKVSVLDLIANLGEAGKTVMVSKTTYWKDLL